jgi:hypothetical protein
MTIKVPDLPTSSKTETISVGATYQTSQSTMNAPSGKNNVGHEITTRPQICSPKCEFLLLVSVTSFNSIPQLFQLIDQGSEHHIKFWSRMVWTMYDEAKKYKFILHAKRRRKIVWNNKYGLAVVRCCVVTERCGAISRQPNANISHVPSKLWIKSCLNPSTRLNLKGAPSPLCSPSHHLCATAYESQFFLRETFISVELQWACNEVAYVQPLLSPFHHHHLQPRHTSIYHILNIVFLPCVPSKKHTTILTYINLPIIHTKPFDKFFEMVHIFRQLIRIQKDIPN